MSGRETGPRAHWVFAAAYDPVSRELERAVLGEQRTRLLAGVTGQVLDVGAGTGANLPYLRHASRVVAAEPDGPCAGGWPPGWPGPAFRSS